MSIECGFFCDDKRISKEEKVERILQREREREREKRENGDQVNVNEGHFLKTKHAMKERIKLLGVHLCVLLLQGTENMRIDEWSMGQN